MLKYTTLNYENKESVKRFYNFYQKILLDNFIFENLGSYQSFIETLNENELYNSLIVYDEKELGGAIFEYKKDTNTGVIHYLVTKDNNKNLKELIFDLTSYHLKEIASEYLNENPEIIQSTPKSKKVEITPNVIHKDEYFLNQIVIPSIKQKTYRNSPKK